MNVPRVFNRQQKIQDFLLGMDTYMLGFSRGRKPSASQCL